MAYTPTITFGRWHPTFSSSSTIIRVSTDIPTILWPLTALIFRRCCPSPSVYHPLWPLSIAHRQRDTTRVVPLLTRYICNIGHSIRHSLTPHAPFLFRQCQPSSSVSTNTSTDVRHFQFSAAIENVMVLDSVYSQRLMHMKLWPSAIRLHYTIPSMLASSFFLTPNLSTYHPVISISVHWPWNFSFPANFCQSTIIIPNYIQFTRRQRLRSSLLYCLPMNISVFKLYKFLVIITMSSSIESNAAIYKK